MGRGREKRMGDRPVMVSLSERRDKSHFSSALVSHNGHPIQQ